MKKLFIVCSMALSFAILTPNSANAQSKEQRPVSKKSIQFTPNFDFVQAFDNPQGRRSNSYWVQLFHVYLDVYLVYGYSATQAIDMAEQSVYGEIEQYYGVILP